MKFRILLYIYIGIVLSILFVNVEFYNRVIWIAAISVFFTGMVVLGVSVMRLNFFIHSFSEIYTKDKEIALTFDDGPDHEITPRIMDLLKEFNAKATFFCIGNKINEEKEVIQRMLQEGHSIGNHTFEHSNSFPWWSVIKMKASIAQTDEALKEAGVNEISMFRPPFGVTNNLIATAIKQTNKKCVGWSIRTKDTCRSVDEVVNKVKKELKPGDIVLLHDTHPDILTELREILIYCRQKGFKPIALN